MIKVNDGEVLKGGKFIDLVNDMNNLCQSALQNEELLAAFMLALNNYQREMADNFCEHLREDPERYLTQMIELAKEEKGKMN